MGLSDFTAPTHVSSMGDPTEGLIITSINNKSGKSEASTFKAGISPTTSSPKKRFSPVATTSCESGITAVTPTGARKYLSLTPEQVHHFLNADARKSNKKARVSQAGVVF